jgi:hypothetical protein
MAARYIPAGFDQYQSTVNNNIAVVYWKEYQIEKDGSLVSRYHAMGYRGTASKPTFNYTFRKVENMNTYILSFFDGVRASQIAKEKRQKEKKEFTTTFKPGDILCESWGYEQTNINFYQVIEVSGKQTIIIREVCGTVEEKGFMQGTCIPRPNIWARDSLLMKKRVQCFGTSEYVTISSYSSARKWDGSPKFCSWYG